MKQAFLVPMHPSFFFSSLACLFPFLYLFFFCCCCSFTHSHHFCFVFRALLFHASVFSRRLAATNPPATLTYCVLLFFFFTIFLLAFNFCYRLAIIQKKKKKGQHGQNREHDRQRSCNSSRGDDYGHLWRKAPSAVSAAPSHGSVLVW